MTAFHGGKQRIGRKIANIIYCFSSSIESDLEMKICGYWEPFCGMCGVYEHIPESFQDRKLTYKASDIHTSLILMWQQLQQGWLPPQNISMKKYYELENSKPSALKGYVGFGYSFGGIYFQGPSAKYGRIKNGKAYVNRLDKMSKIFKDVKFTKSSYDKINKNIKNYIIYCDPPYQKTASKYYNDDKSRSSLDFDNNKFWRWVRKMSKNNIVFVSETSAPKDFISIITLGSQVNYRDSFGKFKEYIFMHCKSLLVQGDL